VQTTSQLVDKGNSLVVQAQEEESFSFTVSCFLHGDALYMASWNKLSCISHYKLQSQVNMVGEHVSYTLDQKAPLTEWC